MAVEAGAVAAPLGVWAAKGPEKIALIGPARRATYRELNERACRLANALAGWGIGPEAKVAALLHNSLEFIELRAALGKLRATLVPLNYRLKGPEIDYILRDSDAVAFVAGAEFLETIRPLYAALPGGLRGRIAVVGDASGAGGLLPPETAFEALLASGESAEPPVEVGPSAGSMIYTSGTTGRPKGVYRSTAGKDQTNLLAILRAFRLGPDDRHLVCCPLYHASPNAFSGYALLFAGTLVVMPRFDPVEFLERVQRHRITSSAVVPTVLNRVVSLPDEVKRRYDTSSLRALITAGAPFPFPLKRRVVEFFGDDCLFEFYGSTELGINTILFPEDQLRKPGSCGRLAPGVEIRLLDAEGREVPRGEAGEVYVRSDYVLDGYHKNEAATRAAERDGFHSVGDVARADADGYYYLVDRRIDMVISGGVNIYPAEIEATILAHPDVSDAAVIGVPDPGWGESLRAYVVRRDPTSEAPSDADLIAHCRERMADYKCPRAFVFVTELPYSPSGKLLKRELREAALRELGYDPATYRLGT